MVNYFELYNIPVSFSPDTAAVKRKYYELSRLYHPDRFAQADAKSRDEALRMAAINNEAYKTLNDADALMAYILKQHQLLEDEEKYSLPPDFLMEMMDLNETISDYEMEPHNAALKTQAEENINALLSAWEAETEPITARYNAGEHAEALLLQLKDQYFRKKYLVRIRQRISDIAGGLS